MNELNDEQKKVLEKIFVKNALLEKNNIGERVLVEILLNIAGNFYTKLWECYWSADFHNKQNLEEGFPDVIGAFNRYSLEVDYFEYLQKKYLNKVYVKGNR